ncbi:vascular endothelial growth factor A isoform X1 [Rhipicephalus sanguineus]|uniref:vascular endothelial growth factor A isoform X1 n=1 Tax=Rhipicephalus sanguineus TaxID=34632 RepID=UPI001892FB3C|nr:vascular endothelial growth factor A isoform X1 [Rhipicephalus sanguineus]
MGTMLAVLCTLAGLVEIAHCKQRPRSAGDSCWAATDSHLAKKRVRMMSLPRRLLKIPVQVVRQLNEAQDLHDVLRICSGGTSASWRRIGTYGYLLWQIRSYEGSTMRQHLQATGQTTYERRKLLDAPRSNRADTIDDEMMQGDAPAEQRKRTLRLDKRAACSPRPVPVRVPQPRDTDALFYPTCADVERCAGCCGHHLLRCRASAFRNVTRQVFALRLASNKSNAINFEGFKNVRLVEHAQCRCECKVRPHHCSRGQTYREDQCQCVCTNAWMANHCSGAHIWDARRCACVCRRADTECSTGMRFDRALCRCVKDLYNVAVMT